jgi:succinate dehydrogenase/fumarate reductase flavoprotein subunit
VSDGEPFEILVCGAGMAGLCAAATATQAGSRPLVIEKGLAAGGSMRMSGGTIWTAPTLDVMERWVPGGDRVRQRRLADGLRAGLAWLASLGVEELAPIASDRQVGAEVDVEQLTQCLTHAVEEGGGRIETGAALESLELDRSGRVTAVTACDDGGRRRQIAARVVVLATGGFGGDPCLRVRHLGPNADQALLRANPHSTGDALRAVLEAGGRPTPSMATVYGHTMPGLPADPPPERWTSVTQYATQDGILVNLAGERFFDESRSMADERAATHLLRQPGARGVLLLDRRIHDDLPLQGRSRARVNPNFANAITAGAPHAVADTIDDLADALAGWGVDRSRLIATIDEFGRAVGGGRGSELPVPRTGSPFGLVEPPFRALGVRAGITFTLGGIDVDADLRVLDDTGRPIGGLYAAGADAGGTYEGGYMGGLVLGLVQGRAAGAMAAAAARRLAA